MGEGRKINGTVEIHRLSEGFFSAYPHDRYPEIPLKQTRPYACLLIEYIDGTFVCVPFRTHVRHPYAYHFRASRRSRSSCSGLDYTKSILLRDKSYLDTSAPAIVDNDEYTETMRNLPRIIEEVFRYIAGYRDHINGTCPLHPREYQRRYGRSTLPYFDIFLK